MLVFGGAAATAAGFVLNEAEIRSLRTSRLAQFVTATTGLGVVAVGLWLWPQLPDYDQLRQRIDQVVPANLVMVEEDEWGNFWCFDECLGVSRRYLVPSHDDDVLDGVERALAHEGYTVEQSVLGGISADNGRVDLHVSISDEQGATPAGDG